VTTQRLPPPRKNLRRDIRELMNVKRGKDLHAFRRRHLEPLYRLARVLCRDEAAAQDLAVAALGDCLERSSTWSRDEQLHAWLHARLVVAWLRQQKQEGTVVEKSPPVASDAPVRRGRRRRKPRGGSRPPQPTGPQRPSEPDGELAFSADGYLPGPPTVDWSGTVADVD